MQDSKQNNTCSTVLISNSIVCFFCEQTLKDWKLLLVVLGVVGFGIFLVLLQVAIPPLRPFPTLRPNSELGNNTRNVRACVLLSDVCVLL